MKNFFKKIDWNIFIGISSMPVAMFSLGYVFSWITDKFPDPLTIFFTISALVYSVITLFVFMFTEPIKKKGEEWRRIDKLRNSSIKETVDFLMEVGLHSNLDKFASEKKKNNLRIAIEAYLREPI